MVFSRVLGSWGFVLSLLTVSSVAAPAWVGAAEDVEAIFKKGTELRREGRDAEALVEFQRAARIQDSPRAIAQVALAEQAMGLWIDAHTHLQRALEHGSDSWIQKNRPALDGARDTIRSHLCHVEAWGSPVGAEILIDGKRAGNLPTISTWVLGGEVSFQVKANGHVELRKVLKVPDGGHVREHVDLRLLDASLAMADSGTGGPAVGAGPPSLVAKPIEPPQATEGVDAPMYRRWWLWTLIGVGVVAAGGTTFWLVTRNGSGADACTQPCSTW